MLAESDLSIPLYVSGRRALVMGELGRGVLGFGEKVGRVVAGTLAFLKKLS